MMGKVTFKNYNHVFPSISNFCETFPDKLHVRDDCIPLFIDFSVEVLIFDQFIKIDTFHPRLFSRSLLTEVFPVPGVPVSPMSMRGKWDLSQLYLCQPTRIACC